MYLSTIYVDIQIHININLFAAHREHERERERERSKKEMEPNILSPFSGEEGESSLRGEESPLQSSVEKEPSSPHVNRVLSLVGVQEKLTISRIFEAAPDFSVLMEVDLSGNASVPKEEWSSILSRLIIGLPRLTTLDLKNNGLGSENGIQLFRLLLKNCEHLVYVDVSDNSLQDESMEGLAPLLSEFNLEVLVLSNNLFTGCGVVELARGLEKNNSLRELALSGNELGNMGVLEIAEVALSHPSLNILDLSSNHVGDDGAICLAYEMENRRTRSALEQLFLSNNDIGDRGLEAISEALRCSTCRLIRLDLSRNARITAQGRRLFTRSASTWRSLQYLDLTCSNLDEKDGHSLAHAIRQSKCSLKEVVVSSNAHLSPDAIESIERAIDRKGVRWWESGDFRSVAMDAGVYVGLGLSLIAVASFFAISRKLFPGSRINTLKIRQFLEVK